MIEEGIQTTVHTLTSLSIDVVFVGMAMLLMVIVGWIAGKADQLSLSLSVYPTAAILFARPEWATITGPVPTLGILVVTYFASFIVLRRFIITAFPFTKLFKTIESLAIGITGAGALISLAATTGALSPIYTLSPQVAGIFFGPWALWLWLLSILAVLLTLVRR